MYLPHLKQFGKNFSAAYVVFKIFKDIKIKIYEISSQFLLKIFENK